MDSWKNENKTLEINKKLQKLMANSSNNMLQNDAFASLNDAVRYIIAAYYCFVFIVGTFGNTITFAALLYGRRRCNDPFR